MLGKKLFIIAEIGGNHEGDPEYALRLCELACQSGADAVKFQIYTGDDIVSKIEGTERNKHFKKFELDYKLYEKLASTVRAAGLEFMASLWDARAVDHFNPLIAIHKVGSGDLTNYPLLRKIAQTDKPLILATAMSTLDDIRGAVQFIDSVNPSLRKTGKLCLMHCVAMYGDLKDRYANLLAIRTLQEAFPDIHIGYSDHTVGTLACEVAVSMGCRVLEMHFTDNKTREFRDHALSVTKEELLEFRARAERILELLGVQQKNPVSDIESPERIRDFRRAVYFRKDTMAGTIVTADHLVTLRPNVGVDARMFDQLIGKRLRRDIVAFKALTIDDFE